jgi:hypothetical protein
VGEKVFEPATERKLFAVYAGATLLRRVLLVSVDGGLALLPTPKPQLNGLVSPF